MMKKYIRYIPKIVDYDLFPYNIIFSDDKYDTIIGVIDKNNRKAINVVYMMFFTPYNIYAFYNAKMSKSIADIIIKEIMKCT